MLFIGTIHLPFGTGSLTGLELTKKARLGMPRIHLSNSHPSDTRTTAMLRSFVVVVMMVVGIFVFVFRNFTDVYVSSGDQTQVLMLTRQALYQLSYYPRLGCAF